MSRPYSESPLVKMVVRFNYEWRRKSENVSDMHLRNFTWYAQANGTTQLVRFSFEEGGCLANKKEGETNINYVVMWNKLPVKQNNFFIGLGRTHWPKKSCVMQNTKTLEYNTTRKHIYCFHNFLRRSHSSIIVKLCDSMF